MSDNVAMAPQTEKQDMSVVQRMLNIFVAPRQAFESINRKPDFLVPFIIVLLVIVAFTFAIMPVVMPTQMEKQRAKMEERGMSEEQINQAMSIGQKTGTIIGPIAAGVSTAIILLVMAGLYMFTGNVMLGGQTTFKHVFSVVTYSALIGSLGQLLSLPIILSKKTAEVHFSLATFLSEDSVETILYQFLKKIDLFAVWGIIVTGIGLAVIYRFTTKKGVTISAIWYVLYMVISLVWFGFTH